MTVQPIAILYSYEQLDICASCLFVNNALLVGYADGYAGLWDLTLKRLKLRWKAHDDRIIGVWFNEERFITHGRDQVLKLWDYNSTLLHSFHVDAYSFCTFVVAENTLVVPGEKQVRLIDFHGRLLYKWEIEKARGQLMCLNASKGYIYEAYENGSVIKRPISAPNDYEAVLEPSQITITSIDVNSTTLYCCTAEGSIFVKDMAKNKLKTLEINSERKKGCSSIKSEVSKAKYFIVGCWDGGVRVIQRKDMKLLALLTHHKKAISAVAFDGDRFIVADETGEVSLWSLYNQST